MGEEFIWEYRNPYEWMKRVRKSSMPPIIICCACTGGLQGKESNPNLPETPEEQVEQVYDAYKAGATMVHLHIRDPNCWYRATSDPNHSQMVNGMIREKCPDIIINNSTGVDYALPPEERVKVLDARPEIATLNMGPDVYKYDLKAREDPIPHPRQASHIEGCMPIDFAEVSLFAREMQKRSIKPEMEIYYRGQFWFFEEIKAQELIETPYLIQFVMGYQASSYATPNNLLGLVNELPDNSIFTVAGISQFQLPMVVLSILLGGHVRVGMEDNIFYSKGRLLENNAEEVERVVRIIKDMNREIATPAQARQIMGISEKPSKY